MNRSKPIPKNREGTTCPYSDSCFTCPLPDCIIGSCYASGVNILPTEMGFNRSIKGIQSEAERLRAIKKRAKEVAERRGRHTTNNK